MSSLRLVETKPKTHSQLSKRCSVRDKSRVSLEIDIEFPCCVKLKCIIRETKICESIYNSLLGEIGNSRSICVYIIYAELYFVVSAQYALSKIVSVKKDIQLIPVRRVVVNGAIEVVGRAIIYPPVFAYCAVVYNFITPWVKRKSSVSIDGFKLEQQIAKNMLVCKSVQVSRSLLIPESSRALVSRAEPWSSPLELDITRVKYVSHILSNLPVYLAITAHEPCLIFSSDYISRVDILDGPGAIEE